MSDHLVEALQGSIEVALSDMNTAMPGRVVSFDPASNRAVVRPDLPKAIADGRDLDPPPIHEVVVAWPKGGGMLTTWPLREGDGVLLLFAQRSLEQWLDGNNQAPDDPRRFDLSDCVALPGLVAADVAPDPDAVQCEFSGTKVRLEPGGVTRLQGTSLVVEMSEGIHARAPASTWEGDIGQQGNYYQSGGNFGTQGRVDAVIDVASRAVSLRSHAHSNSGGTGVGGPPVGGGA